MVSKFRQHFTYANVMATLAVFIALGGSSYAAVRLKANSVGSRQIAPNAVKASEIAMSAVESSEIRNGSLRSVDFARLPTGLRGEKGATGSRGARGPQGEKGTTGARGADAATNLLVRLGVSVDLVAGASTPLQAVCNPGERAVGGGASFLPAESASFAQVTSSYPSPSGAGDTPTSWTVSVHNQAANASSIQFQSYAVCISP